MKKGVKVFFIKKLIQFNRINERKIYFLLISGIAYVCFKKPESVTLGLELNNTLVDERPIRVERYSKHKLGEKKKEKSEVKQLTGPARRIKEKEKKKGNKLPGQIIEKKKNKKVEISSKDSHKKSDYRGVQIKKKVNI